MVRAVRLPVMLLCLAACSPTNRNSADDDGNVDAALQQADAGGSGSNTETSLVYAHSGTTLYRIDADTFAANEIGTISGLGGQSLTDLAVDKTGAMVGVTLDKLYSIDPTTAAATLVKALAVSGDTSLSFVPTDLNDVNSADILVTANDQGDVYQIDETSGASTKIGSYGTAGAGKVISSGDLIGVRGLGIYATVNVGTEANDYLAAIDPTTWKATPLGTGTGYKNIFGLGFWQGTIFGFVDDGTGAGTMITIDKNTGVGTKIGSGTQQWFGAGVTTNAPVLE